MRVGLKGLNKKLNPEFKEILKKLSLIAERLNLELYIVGGPVRDLLLKHKTVDLDLLLDSHLNEFLKLLEKEYKIKIVRTSFLTAKIYFKNLVIDIAQARKEIYIKPGALPEVSPGTLEEDALRRDFSINALMLRVERGEFTQLIDYVYGLKDLKNGLIRILYDRSYWDDPTRIIRALRYEKRFNFKIESRSFYLLKKAIKENVFSTLSPQRLGAEFLRTLKEEILTTVILKLSQLNGLTFLSKKIRLTRRKVNLLKEWDKFKDKQLLEYHWLMPLFIISNDLEFNEINFIVSILELPRSQRRLIFLLYDTNVSKLLNYLAKNLNPEEIYDKLENLNLYQVTYLYLLADGKARRNLEKFIYELSKIKLEITGEEVKKMGVREGKAIGKVLKFILKAKIKGEIKDKIDEVRLLKNLVSSKDVDRLP